MRILPLVGRMCRCCEGERDGDRRVLYYRSLTWNIGDNYGDGVTLPGLAPKIGDTTGLRVCDTECPGWRRGMAPKWTPAAPTSAIIGSMRGGSWGAGVTCCVWDSVEMEMRDENL
jgi:hypothetical protein